MIALLQRVSEASVHVSGRKIAGIGRGILVLLAVEPGDERSEVERMSERLLKFRLFGDETGRMNRDISQVGGELLLVPQFTLAADTASGHRPGFSGAAAPELGRQRFLELVATVRGTGQAVATGEFGADMQVALVNDGPVTFLLRVTRDHQTLTNPRPMPRD
jgi:D-aminoacyl-tRNA deacylase